MRHMFLKVFLAGLLLVFSSVVSAQSSDLLTSLSGRSNVRSGPGVDWAIVGTYDAGTPIRLDGQAFEGSWVRGILPDGNVGWVINSAVVASIDQTGGLRGIWVDEPFSLSAPAGGAPAPQQAAPAAQAQPNQPQTQPPAASSAPSGSVETGISATLKLRNTPSSSGGMVREVDFSERVVVDGRNDAGDWVRATLPDGARGWLFAAYVYLTEERIMELPVVQGGATAPAAPAAAEPSAPVESAAAPAGPPIASSASLSGFNLGGHVASLSANTVSAMRTSGMTWVKKQLRYNGQDPSAAAGMINEAHANGFRILLGIVGDPGSVNEAGYFERFAGFLGGVAALQADAIEVWNEPNIDREWAAGSISPSRYTEMLRFSYNAIKGANPSTIVISGAPAPTGYFGGCGGGGCDDDAFVRGMAAAGAARYMDCIGAHYNEGIVPPGQTSGDPRGNSSHYSRYFWGMVNTYNSAFGGARPICFTELGYLTPEGYPPLPGGFAWAENVSVGQQAQWLAQAAQLAAGSGRVRLMIVWNVDFTNYGSDPMAGYAMIRADGSCPACSALAGR